MNKICENKLFLFGGCYSNLQATERVKEIAIELGFESHQIICTGDVVGYCAEPEKTVQLIKNWGIQTIAGNVEVQLREGLIDCGCNFDKGSRCDSFSAQWYPFAQDKLSKNSIAWMQKLPEFLDFNSNDKRIHVLHGGPNNISEFIFASSPVSRKLEIFEQTNSDIIVAGHAGLPFTQKMRTKLGQEKIWINAGVIGMPANDGTSRCWFAVLDTLNFTIEFHAFKYNHIRTSELMLANNLTKEYAKTLKTGLWDNCEILPAAETKAQGHIIKADIQH